MFTAASTGTRQCLAWFAQTCRARPYTLFFALVASVLLVQFCTRKDSEWEWVFVDAAQHLWSGQELYGQANLYLYPPFTAWAAYPFIALPPLGLRLVWFAINLAAVIVLMRFAWILSGGAQLQGSQAIQRSEHVIFCLGLACGLGFILNCFAHQQTDVVTAALVLGGCWCLSRARPMRAATMLGLAAAVKCTPLLWMPYLAWRGQWRAAVWVGVVALGLNVLPDLTCPAPSGQLWLAEYAQRYLEPLGQSDFVPGSWGSDAIYNQSLAGASKRWLSGDLGMSVRAVRVGLYAYELMLLGLAAWLMGRPLRAAADAPVVPPRTVLEYSVIVLLMLLLSPMSSPAHFGLLILPGFCVARLAVLRRDRALWGLLLMAVVGALLKKDLLGNNLYTWGLHLGMVMWTTLALLVACLVALRLPAIAARPTALERPQRKAA